MQSIFVRICIRLFASRLAASGFLVGLVCVVAPAGAAVAPYAQDFNSAATPAQAGFSTSGFGTWSIVGGALNFQGSTSGSQSSYAAVNLTNVPGADFAVSADIVINSQSSPPSTSSSTAIMTGFTLLAPSSGGGSPSLAVNVMTQGWGGNDAGRMTIQGLGTAEGGGNQTVASGQFNDTIAPLKTGVAYTLTAVGVYNTDGSLTIDFTVSEQGGPSTTITGTVTTPGAGVYFGIRNRIAIWNTTSSANISVDNFAVQGGNDTTPGGGTLTATLSTRPNLGLYKPGETVGIQFNVTNGSLGQALKITVKDEHEATIATQSYTVTAGTWSQAFNAPAPRLGFYRVYASLYDGSAEVTKLTAPNASRLNGYLTYAIVPDPAQRPDSIPDTQAAFGQHGGFHIATSTDIFAFMGWRWGIDGGWRWESLSPSTAQKFNGSNPPGRAYAWATDGAGGPWTMYIMPSLTKNGRPYGGNPDVYKPGTFAYNTGALKQEAWAENDWQDFCAAVATSYPTVYPERTRHMYEMTWEPIQSWGYKGTDADLVRFYQLAYSAVKAAKPEAWVIGPCMHVNNLVNLTQNYELFDLGLGEHIDAFSAHPYMDHDIATSSNPFTAPELSGQPCLIHTMKRRLREYAGADVPMIGNEQGYRTRIARRDTSTQQVANQPPLGTQPNLSTELHQARRLVRANLLTLGEGWRVNLAFYVADYPTNDSIDGQAYWDWGFFYNMNTTLSGGYGPDKLSPKPIVAAYAAMTFLIENRKSVCDINWLGDTVRGYAFEHYDNANDVVLALWDFTREPGNPRQVTIDTGVGSVDVYDWMGNKTTRSTINGLLTVDLSKEPVYLNGVTETLWGSARPDRNLARNKPAAASSTANPDYPAALAVDGDSVSYLSRWLSADSISSAKWIEVDLGGDHEINGVRFWTGQYQSGWHTNTYQLPLPSYNIQRWDGAQWVNIVSRSGNTKAVVDETFAPVTTNKVRLYVPAWAINQVMLYELEVLDASPAASLQGDLNGDGFVGLADMNIVLSRWGQSVTPGDPSMGDPSGDGAVGLSDLNIVLSNWGASNASAWATPLPAGMANA